MKECETCEHRDDLVKSDGKKCESSVHIVEKKDSEGRITDLYPLHSPACEFCPHFLDLFNGFRKE